MGAEGWTDLLDPTPDELSQHLPPEIHERAWAQLAQPARHEDEPRPKLESHGDYVFGVLLVAASVPGTTWSSRSETRTTSCCALRTGLDLSHDLLAGVRDFHQSKIANDQNEVIEAPRRDRLHPPPP